MTRDLYALLRQNSYPGRGILLGRSAGGDYGVTAYFIMGRSANSRNRVFETTKDGIRTRAFDESKMTDPSLIIYHPVRQLQNQTIVTNGVQTDGIRDALNAGEKWDDALKLYAFEPDAPNYTPRISGILTLCSDTNEPYVRVELSILKSLDGNPDCCCRYFYKYENIPAGSGRFISTYRGDGNPLPSFQGEPIPAAIHAPDAKTLADQLWESLNEENKISLFVQYTSLRDGSRDTAVINKHQERR